MTAIISDYFIFVLTFRVSGFWIPTANQIVGGVLPDPIAARDETLAVFAPRPYGDTSYRPSVEQTSPGQEDLTLAV